MEDFDIHEQVHARSVSHIREGEGTYDGTAVLGEDGTQGGGNKGGKPKPKPAPKDKATKKEKTEDQLARAVVRSKT